MKQENFSLAERKRREDLFNNLGHPFPVLLFDEVVDLARGESIKTLKLITANEFYLAGHFPGHPIVPGVLTLEGMIQSAIFLIAETFSRGKLECSLQKVGKVRFKRPIYPGDRLEFSVQVVKRENTTWHFRGQAQIGQENAAEAQFSLQVDFREVGFEI
ncbi:MAG: 3-hydroxyacyl-ACP dehydratase FabZ [bacterium]